MITVILSDVHGNNAALQAVLEHVHTHYTPTEIWFLGDLVGYGPDPFLVWQTLCSEPIPLGGWLAGNHDWGLIGRLKGPAVFYADGEGAPQAFQVSNFREAAWQVLEWQQELLENKDELQEHLQTRPVMSQPRPGVYLTHGAFDPRVKRSITRYSRLPLTSPPEMVDAFHAALLAERSTVFTASNDEKAPPQLFAFGHTHIPGFWQWQVDESKWQKLSLEQPHPFRDLDSQPLCLNPGSVGFPRDGSGCPSYAVVEWQTKVLHFHRVDYNVKATQDKMQVEPYRLLLDELGFLPNCVRNKE